DVRRLCDIPGPSSRPARIRLIVREFSCSILLLLQRQRTQRHGSLHSSNVAISYAEKSPDPIIGRVQISMTIPAAGDTSSSVISPLKLRIEASFWPSLISSSSATWEVNTPPRVGKI